MEAQIRMLNEWGIDTPLSKEAVKRYQAVMVLSDHETLDEALEAMFEALDKEN